MTPLALITFGAAAYFVFRLRFIVLDLIWEWMVRRNEKKDRKLRLEEDAKRHDVGFYTVDQIWGDEKEKKSA